MTAFCTALAEAGDGGKSLTAIKNDKRAALCALVRTLAGDVTEECLGDLTVLLTSGFPMQKPARYPIGDLPAPAVPRSRSASTAAAWRPGVPPVYGALTYNWQLAAANAPTVILQTDETSAASTSFAGLIRGHAYIVQANAVGTAGTSDWSQPTIQMVV